MKKKIDLIDYKKKYDLTRHQAWAGLGFLSVLLAIRILFPNLTEILQPILIIDIVYIVASLILTYKYYKGLTISKDSPSKSVEIRKDELDYDLEKKRLKIEKKKLKSEEKAKKKSNKK